MSKGKEHQKYEFGAKASVVIGKNNGVILGAYSLPKNDYDGHALEPTLAQVERVSGYRPAVAIGDKGFRGFKLTCRAQNGNYFRVGSGLASEEVDEFEHTPPIGRKAKVKYEMLSDDGTPLKPTLEAII